MTTPQPPQKQTPAAALQSIGIFADLREDQLEWFVASAAELRFSPGDVLLREGDPTDKLYVVLEGEMRGRQESGGPGAPGFVARAGQVTGKLPFSRMTRAPMTVRATLPSWLLSLHEDHFQEMLQ
ncbi:MAG TPA: cyclic nucleotide-binding domain-containing protein, partial [Bryobacteraceae bacterium]|nr:cyclic nucleotide-binding domain-containing protein [Bryobacteraceae bacterium]